MLMVGRALCEGEGAYMLMVGRALCEGEGAYMLLVGCACTLYVRVRGRIHVAPCVVCTVQAGHVTLDPWNTVKRNLEERLIDRQRTF